MVIGCSYPVQQHSIQTSGVIMPAPIAARSHIAHQAAYNAVMPTMERSRLEQDTEKYQKMRLIQFIVLQIRQFQHLV